MKMRWAVVAVVVIGAVCGVTLGRTDAPPIESFGHYITSGGADSARASAIQLTPALLQPIPVSAKLTLQPRDLSVLSQQAVDYLATREPQWGVAVALPKSGVVYESNASESFAMASVTKVLIMATLLAQSEAGTHAITDADRDVMTSMITESDNDSAVALWDEVGGATAINAFLNAKDIHGITPAGVDPSWGDSTATPAAMVQLLTKLWAGVLLNRADTAYALQLMTNVIPDQRWGVAAGFPADGVASALKDGWYDATTGWRVSSVGIDASTATPEIAVIMTRNQQSMEGAQSTIEGAAARIGTAVFGLPGQPAIDPPAAGTATDVQIGETAGVNAATVSGSCRSQSGVALRPDAWSCTTPHGDFDPCFQRTSSANGPLVCATGESEGVVSLHSTAPLPVIEWTTDWAHPWRVTLADGTVCYRKPSPQANDDGDHVTYTCSNGAVLVGPLQRSATWWALESDRNLQTFEDARVSSVTY